MDNDFGRASVASVLLHEPARLTMHLEAVRCRWNMLIRWKDMMLVVHLVRLRRLVHGLLDRSLIYRIHRIWIARRRMFLSLPHVMLLL